MRNERDQISPGPFDRRAAEARAFREAVLVATMFGTAVLAAGLLGVMFIAFMEALGIWAPMQPEATSFATESTKDLGWRSRAFLRLAAPLLPG